jgi:hypothetical protein
MTTSTVFNYNALVGGNNILSVVDNDDGLTKPYVLGLDGDFAVKNVAGDGNTPSSYVEDSPGRPGASRTVLTMAPNEDINPVDGTQYIVAVKLPSSAMTKLPPATFAELQDTALWPIADPALFLPKVSGIPQASPYPALGQSANGGPDFAGNSVPWPAGIQINGGVGLWVPPVFYDEYVSGEANIDALVDPGQYGFMLIAVGIVAPDIAAAPASLPENANILIDIDFMASVSN